MKFKRILYAILISIATITFSGTNIPFSKEAYAEFPTSGNCGENSTWNLTDGVLTISGTGDMGDYTYSKNVPWYNIRGRINSVIIESGITNICDYAFYYSTHIDNISIPDTVTSINEGAFILCKELTNITVDSNNPVFTSIDGVLYNKNVDKLVFCPANKSDVNIPASVTTICEYSFADGFFSSITLPDNIKEIEAGAFSYCRNLTDINIPSGVTTIGNFAFKSCSSLTSITIPDSVISLGTFVFDDCSSLTNITLPNNLEIIDTSAFFYCKSLTSITIPSSVKSIGSYAFDNCESLTSIVIPDSVTYIDANAFCNCSGLTSVVISNSLTSLEAGTFYGCSSLTNAVIPDSVTSIDSGVFYGCSSLTSVVVPDSVTKIHPRAFIDSDLKTVYCRKGSAADDLSLYPEGAQIIYSDGKTNDEILAEITAASASKTTTEANSGITVLLDGSALSFGVEPYIENGITMVPMRTIFEALGAMVDYASETKTITAVKGDKTIILTVGSTTAYVNSQNVTLQNPAVIADGSTMVPLRFVSESLDTSVAWNGTTKTVTITSN
ncbi:MAG: leucine-rich repeat protein [Eubacterium sp.]|nr:leucine-rich repeat protein [Eubacterium sp.]